MGKYVFLDTDEYRAAQKKLEQADEKLSNTYHKLTSGYFETLKNEHDRHGSLAAAIRNFIEVKGRIGDLAAAMASYLADWEETQAKGIGSIDGVTVISSDYRGDSFGSIYEEEKLRASDYSSYRFYNKIVSGRSFLTDYNDLTSFRTSSVYKELEFLLGNTKINDYGLYASIFGSTAYTDKLMTDSLDSILTYFPGDRSLSIEDFETGDWEALEEQLDAPGLAEHLSRFEVLLKLYGNGTLSEEKMKEMQSLMKVLGTEFKKFPGGQEMFKKLSKAFEKGEVAMQGVELLMDGIYCMVSNYSNQIAYLDSLKESMLAVGYWEDSSLMKHIEEMRELYNDKVAKFAESVFDTGKEIGGEIIKEGICKSFPLLEAIDKGLSAVSSVGHLAGGDRLKAAEELMGLYQYDQQLLETYERYEQLIRDGVATEADFQKAEKLYDLVRASKIKQYENIKTIAAGQGLLGRDEEWYNLACEKLEELQSEVYCPQNVLDEVGDVWGDAAKASK